MFVFVCVGTPCVCLQVHMLDQRALEVGEGPIGLVLAPTRELVIQIHAEARKFMKAFHINVSVAPLCVVSVSALTLSACVQTVALHGGISKWEQTKALKAGCEAVIATPGRLIDLIQSKATNLRRVTFLVCVPERANQGVRVCMCVHVCVCVRCWTRRTVCWTWGLRSR